MVARFWKPKASCYLSYEVYSPNINMSSITYAYNHMQNMYPKVALVEETNGGGKVWKKDSEQ
jgi:hypothetical protein